MKLHNILAVIAPAIVISLISYPFFLLIQMAIYSTGFIKGEFKTVYTGLFDNILRVYTDPLFQISAKVTLIFTLACLALQILLGLFLVIVVANSKLKRLWLSIIMVSIIIPPLSVALIWRFMAYPEIGLLNYLSSLVRIKPIPWLGDPFWATILIIIVDTWHWTSFVFLILYAGYISLPSAPFEAAKVDGASGLQIWKNITLPLLKPTILVALFFRTIDILQAFPELWQLTFGGPNFATTILNILVYIATFQLMDWSYAAVTALTLMLIAIGLVITFYRFVKRGF